MGGGRRIGLNLTENVGSAATEGSENVVWLDGRCVRVSPVRYGFDRARIREPWKITTRDGEVDLEFRPTGGRDERLNLGLVRSRFDKLYGTFHGVLALPGGERVEVDGLRGVCEDHDAVW